MKQSPIFTALALSAVAVVTAACNDSEVSTPVVAAPALPAPTQTSANFDVSRCLTQSVAGRQLQEILFPDILDLDLSQPAGFPNGRDLDDPVVDLTLAAAFLDLTRHPVTTLVNVPVNPNRFDQPLRTTFPFYAAPLGNPPLSPTTGTNFNFRTDPPSSYIRVERAGVPAISTAFVLGARKLTYNDSDPTADAAGSNVGSVLEGYQALTNALNDDFRGLGLTPCAQ